MATVMLNFRKKILKNLLLRSHEAETLHKCLCYYVIHKLFFIAVVHVVSSLWQLLSFHRFIMGKVKVGLYFYLTLFILTKAL